MYCQRRRGFSLRSPERLTLAQEPVTFRGKTITMIVGSQAGGGTDATGRLMAPFLSQVSARQSHA